MLEYIPYEIQAEILKRLPLKLLIQFRSVSKSLKCLIDNPNFIASYGGHHPQPDHFILRYKLPYILDYPNETKFLTLVDNDNDPSFFQQDFVPKLPDLLKKIEPQSWIVGSSLGLLCFNGYYEFQDAHFSNLHGIEMVLLWNPSISKSVGIQVPDMYDSLIGNIGVDKVTGFGVCPVTFDPIIIKIQCIDYNRKLNDMPDISVPWRVRFFTLNTRTWSVLSTNLPRESVRLRGSQVVIDKFIYWVAFDIVDPEDDRSRFLIVSFDLTAKEFNEINLRDSLTNRHCMIKTISKLRESLVLLEYHREFEDESVCCLWMMKEQGVSKSFTKLYNIYLPDKSINQILGFRKTGELILETQQQYQRYAEVEIYDRNYGEEYLGIEGEEYLFCMCSYMETLLLLDHSDGYIYYNSNVGAPTN